MIKTVFGKIMLLFMVIIMLSLFISGLMMSSMVRGAYLEDNETQMLSVANDISALYSFYLDGNLTVLQTVAQMRTKADAGRLVIWVVKPEGKVWFSADPTSFAGALPDGVEIYYNEMLGDLSEGKTVKLVTEEANIFGTPVITVAKPVFHGGEIASYVFIHKKVGEMEASLVAVYRQILLAACISALLGIILTYLFSRSMLRPLTVVNTGAKQLAKGKFNIYLEVKSKDEIGQLAQTFNTLAEDLQKYEKTRINLVANVSHELRSPLTSIQGLLNAVLDGTVPKEECGHYLGIVLDEARRLNVMINDLLDLSKIESGKFPLQMEKVDINELICRVLLPFESKIEAKKLDVSIELEGEKVYVLADVNRITQVLQNLIENAVKFSEEDGRLRIYTTSTHASVFININNTGRPVDKEDLPYLFDRFYKVDTSHSRKIEGTGLGLSIVKNILKAHGQKIWVRSNAQEGTTFTFTLKKV